MRDLVSQLRRLRRDLGFAVSDRIRLWIVAPEAVEAAITAYHHWIANELLAGEIVFGEPPVGHQARHELDLDGPLVRIALTKEL